MKTVIREAWIDHFVSVAGVLDDRAVPSGLAKVAEQLWYSFHDETPGDIARLWATRALPEMLMRDAWLAACSHRLSFFDQQMASADAEALARSLHGIDRLRAMDPYAAAEAWRLVSDAPAG